MRLRLELMQLESVKSMMRYAPPNGTDGLAMLRVRGYKRSPAPPARSIASTFSTLFRVSFAVYALLSLQIDFNYAFDAVATRLSDSRYCHAGTVPHDAGCRGGGSDRRRRAHFAVPAQRTFHA